jgi:hypothetical protein
MSDGTTFWSLLKKKRITSKKKNRKAWQTHAAFFSRDSENVVPSHAKNNGGCGIENEAVGQIFFTIFPESSSSS